MLPSFSPEHYVKLDLEDGEPMLARHRAYSVTPRGSTDAGRVNITKNHYVGLGVFSHDFM